MFEAVKEVDEETIINKHIMQFSRDNTTSIHAGNVQDIEDINYLLIIEAGVTKKGIMDN